MITDTLDQNTWWASQIHEWAAIHGGQPTYMVAWPASRPALVGGQVGWGPGGRAGPAQGARQGGKTKQGGKTEVSKMSPGGGTRTHAYFLVLAHLETWA